MPYEDSDLDDLEERMPPSDSVDQDHQDATVDIDLPTWERALFEATRVALRLYSGLAVSSLSLDPSDPVESIAYRSRWLRDRDAGRHVPALCDKTEDVIGLAMKLVSSGDRPYAGIEVPRDNTDLAMWPMFNALDAINNAGVFADPDYLHTAARTALRSAWSSIQKLTVEACIQTRLSTFEVWDILCPTTTNWLKAEAYSLAAFAVASGAHGIEPTYLSIFNMRDHGFEYLVSHDGSEQLTFEQLAILACVGPVAAFIATEKILLNAHDPIYQAAIGHIRPESGVAETSIKAFWGMNGRAADAFLQPHWRTVENLATLLLREYCLVGEEIDFVLHGGDLRDWSPRY